MAILVTGGAGYIGSHTCVELLAQGLDIIILDNFSNSKPQVLAYIQELSGRTFSFYEADLLDIEAVRSVFSKESITAVIHFAGLKAVGESVTLPLSYYQNNVAGTLNLCQVMAEFDCHQMVFSSSATVYGTSQDVPFKENSPTSATNPYGWTKVMIEQILTDLTVANPQWSVTLLRYFNPIGAHPSGLLGEDPRGLPNNLVPYIAKVALGELPHLQIFGDDYNTPDGTGVRDYLHVVDLALGHLKALNYTEKETGVHIFNLGTGVGSSVFQVLKAYEKACGKELKYKVLPRREGDIAVCYADSSKARDLLGWGAEKTLGQMCKDSWLFSSKE